MIACASRSRKKIVTATLEDKIGFSESVSRVLRVMRFTIQTRLKVTTMELNFARTPRSEVTNIVKDNESHLSNWRTLNGSPPLQQMLIYEGPSEEKELTDHTVKVGKRKISCCSCYDSPESRPVKLSNGKFQNPYWFLKKTSEKISGRGIWMKNRKLPLTGPNSWSVQQIKGFCIGNQYKHRSNFRNHRRKTCRWTNIN